MLVGFPALAGAVESHVVTSIPLARLPDHVPHVTAIQARVRAILTDPEAARADGATTEAADAVCGSSTTRR